MKVGATFGEKVGALMAMVALAVLAYASVLAKNEQATGALIAVLAAGAGYFLRAKIQPPTP